jgi:signal transduction histidine kinase
MSTTTPSEGAGNLRFERQIADLRQQNVALRDETKSLHFVKQDLAQQLGDVRGSMHAEREARRAALNLMEDAVLARRAETKENRRRQAVEEHLRELDRRKDEFLATLSHELRNPLAAIKGGVQLLASPKAAEDTKAQALEIVARQVDHMQRLIDDVLESSRMIQGKIRIRPEPTELQTLVRQVTETMGEAVTDKTCRFRLNLSPQPIIIDADPVRITQVFANILSNAVKYCDDACQVDIDVRRDDDLAIVSFRDHGIGIAPELLPYVFDLFVQSDGSLDRAGGGLGLGLAVVRDLVELHGGRVEAFSEGVGKGSEFRVYLPTMSAGA